MLLNVEAVTELLDCVSFVLAAPQIVRKETLESFGERLNRIGERIEAIPGRRVYSAILRTFFIVSIGIFIYKLVFYTYTDLPEYIWLPWLVFFSIVGFPELLKLYADAALAISESLFAAGALTFFLARALSIAHAEGYSLP